MTKPRIGIILSTTRETRFADRPARWLAEIAGARGDADYEIVDLRNYPMPYFEAAMSPRYAPLADPTAQRWVAKLRELDGYIFIVAEYNHSIPAVLKNALDQVSDESARKPAAFLGYGTVGAARAVEQLRLVVVEVSMVPTRAAVHINMEPFVGMLQQGKDFGDYPFLATSAVAMLDELVWYAETLRAGREAERLTQAA